MQLIRAKKPKLSMDLAPLIDVVFQLLVFFMLTSTFANPAIRMTLPKAISSDQSELKQIVVSVDQEGVIYINEEIVSMTNLQSSISTLIKKNNDNSVFVKGDAQMPYKTFVEIMDIARQAGAGHVHIVHQK